MTIVEGEPVAVFAPCEGRLQGALLYSSEDEYTDDMRLKRWSFAADESIEFLAVVDYLNQGAGQRYELAAWSRHPGFLRDETKNLTSVWFTADDLSGLEAGEVMFTAEGTYDTAIIGTRAEFEAAACRDD